MRRAQYWAMHLKQLLYKATAADTKRKTHNSIEEGLKQLCSTCNVVQSDFRIFLWWNMSNYTLTLLWPSFNASKSEFFKPKCHSTGPSSFVAFISMTVISQVRISTIEWLAAICGVYLHRSSNIKTKTTIAARYFKCHANTFKLSVVDSGIDFQHTHFPSLNTLYIVYYSITWSKVFELRTLFAVLSTVLLML